MLSGPALGGQAGLEAEGIGGGGAGAKEEAETLSLVTQRGATCVFSVFSFFPVLISAFP